MNAGRDISIHFCADPRVTDSGSLFCQEKNRVSEIVEEMEVIEQVTFSVVA